MDHLNRIITVSSTSASVSYAKNVVSIQKNGAIVFVNFLFLSSPPIVCKNHRTAIEEGILADTTSPFWIHRCIDPFKCFIRHVTVATLHLWLAADQEIGTTLLINSLHNTAQYCE